MQMQFQAQMDSPLRLSPFYSLKNTHAQFLTSLKDDFAVSSLNARESHHNFIPQGKGKSVVNNVIGDDITILASLIKGKAPSPLFIFHSGLSIAVNAFPDSFCGRYASLLRPAGQGQCLCYDLRAGGEGI